MFLRKESFRALAGLMGFETVCGMEFQDREITDERARVLWDEMTEQKALEPADGETWKISALGQMIVNMVTTPDVWIHAENRNTGLNRYLYFRNCYYLYVDEEQEILMIEFLPTLELVIGAYAMVLEGIDRADEKTDILVEGDSPRGELSIRFEGSAQAVREMDYQVEEILYTEESCTNEITGWILRGLKEVENDERKL